MPAIQQLARPACCRRDLERLAARRRPALGHRRASNAINATTPAAFRALWEPLLKTGPVEVMVFGDIKADVAIAAVQKTLGALPAAHRADRLGDAAGAHFPKHNATPVTLQA